MVAEVTELFDDRRGDFPIAYVKISLPMLMQGNLLNPSQILYRFI